MTCIKASAIQQPLDFEDTLPWKNSKTSQPPTLCSVAPNTCEAVEEKLRMDARDGHRVVRKEVRLVAKKKAAKKKK